MKFDFYKWAKGVKPEIKVKIIPFIRLDKDCFVLTNNINKYLQDKKFVQQSNGNFIKDFTIINHNTWTIKHTMSKKETKLLGDIEDYIKYFNRI